MNKNPILSLKVRLFTLFGPLENIYAYNRIRRNEWIKQQVANIPVNSKILDVGAGGCPHKSKFEHCQYFSQDFVQLSNVQIQNQVGYGKIDFISDILNIPVDDESFDVILCTEVIEHVPNPIEALKEMSRILKPGGKLLITAPMQSGLHQEPYHFYGGYTKYWYEKFLRENNFDSIQIEPNGSLYTTYFSLGLTVLKSFLEAVVFDKSLSKKLIGIISFLSFLPVLAFINPLSCFLWESVLKREDFTAGYHVLGIKSK